MKLIIEILFYILTVYIGFSTIYIFFYALFSIFRRDHRSFGKNEQLKTLILIPAYKEDIVILEVAERATQIDYPKDLYDVTIIADHLKPETINKLKQLPIRVIEVVFEKSTKAKALNYALNNTQAPYDICCVIDADNIMEKDFLARINYAFDKGFVAVQGHRVAKNTNTSVALLDAISEEINNSIFRQGHRVLGISSAFIGSGLAVKYDLFKELMKNVSHVGEDKELEMMLLKAGNKIEYIPDAYVYDEKIQQYDNMVNQRRRWLFAQFDFFGKFILDATKNLFLKGNIDYFDKVLQQALIPRSLLIGITGLYFILYLIFSLLSLDITSGMLLYQWINIALLLVLTLMIATPRKYYTAKTLKALIYLPKGIIIMFISLIKSRFSGNTFFHTKHGVE